MSRETLLGLDIGGGGGRCLVVDVESGATTTAYRAWRFRVPSDAPMGSELDPEATWSLLAEATREALQRAGAEPSGVRGLAATGMRHGSALLDDAGRELVVASNRDARGAIEALGLAAQGSELHRRTGAWPNPIQPVGRLLWLAKNDARWPRAAAHLSLSDWLAHRLSGETAAEPTQAGESLLFELERRDWAWDLIDRLELPRRIFPAVREPGSRLGALGATAAADLGLPAGIPVAVGGADTQCGLLGAGVIAPGALGIVAGTSAPLQLVGDRPVRDPDGRLWSSHHLPAGRWVLESNAGGVGESLEWLAGLLYPDAPYSLLALLADADAAPPGAGGLLSTFGAQVMDARDLGLPVGNLTLCHLTGGEPAGRRRNLARAVVEGLAFALRANLEQIRDAAGAEPAEVVLTGGLSRSASFAQLASDALGRPVAVAAAAEATALGAAICAGVGAGVFEDLAQGAAQLARVATRCRPEAERAALYEDLYPAWGRVREGGAGAGAAASPVVLPRITAPPAADETARAAGFRPQILVTADLDSDGLEALARIGDVDYQSYRQVGRLLTGPGLVAALEGVHVFVTEIDVVDAASLAAARDLRAIGVCRGDAVNVDLEAATALGVPVFNTPGRNADAVADLTLAFMLMLLRKLPEANQFLREPGGEAGDMGRMGRAFGRLRGRELWSKTVGLVGLGAVGRKVVERLRPFGARCLVYDPYLAPDAARLAGAEPVGLETLLAASDIVSLHAAVTDESRGLIGERELGLLKPGSLLVNTARAALVDEAALLAALESGHLAGAALDVFAVEPPASDHPLLARKNVVATPHVGGNTAEVASHQGRIVAEDLDRLRRGEAPQHLRNPASLAGFRWAEPRPAPSPELVERLGRGPGPAVTDLQRESRAPRKPATAAPAAAPAIAAEAAPIAEAMRAVLGEFVAAFRTDDQIAAQARGQDVTLHFALTDLGSEFHLGFRDGRAFADLGPPEGDAAVQLKLSADLLDGMFTGRRNAMQAAMEGELSFSGDTAKAMTLSNLQRDLARLYGGARERAGDPGDLTALAAPDVRGAADAPATPGAAGDDLLRAQLIEVVDELYAAHLITATGGNVSVRSTRTEEAWITPSQLFKGDLRPEILVRIDMNARALDEGGRSPSSEALMHTAVLEARPEAQAVIHCHAPHATILANADLPFLPISTEAAFFSDIGRIPFVMPGTQELADAVVEAMGAGWAVLMRNHGLLVAGRSLRRAADMAEVIERTAEVILGCYAVGKEPPTLPAETVKMLARYGDLMA